MKSRALVLIAFFALGFVCNVLVAWSLALLAVDFRGSQGPAAFAWSDSNPCHMMLISSVNGFGSEKVHVTQDTPEFIDIFAEELQTTDFQSIESLTSQWCRETIRNGVPQGSYSSVLRARGWPFLSLWYEEFPMDELKTDGAIDFGLPIRILEQGEGSCGWIVRGERRLLPYRAWWPGTAANSLFYAVVVFGLWAVPSTIHRAHRRRRGLCPDCGYDLRGADHGKCPECGEAVR